MTISIITVFLAAISLLLNSAHHRRWWSPLSTPAILTGFAWLATALACIAAAIEAAIHQTYQPETQAALWVFGAIFPLLFAANTGGPALAHSFYKKTQ